MHLESGNFHCRPREYEFKYAEYSRWWKNRQRNGFLPAVQGRAEEQFMMMLFNVTSTVRERLHQHHGLLEGTVQVRLLGCNPTSTNDSDSKSVFTAHNYPHPPNQITFPSSNSTSSSQSQRR
jgi:hypothetical protein